MKQVAKRKDYGRGRRLSHSEIQNKWRKEKNDLSSVTRNINRDYALTRETLEMEESSVKCGNGGKKRF
jgi:hypothetical protein